MLADLLAGLFPLALFPEGSLASSVITTVWVGVWVIAFFNMRLGWVLSGLVVPGYIVPLFLLEPVSAAVIYFEAAVTYLIVWFFSERLSGADTWSSLFGRDRFLALILTSIGVRLIFDGVLLPILGGFLNENYNLGFDWGRDLESFGLIIIALLANQFWKPGLFSGVLTSLATVMITLMIVRFGLMEATNFRISDIGYLYELMAASFLASPKAYIILVVTAFIASRVNLKYGLDFNGILIPSLIALQWYEPLKIFTSLVEAVIIYALALLVMQLPVLRDRTIEGARKLLLFFNVSFGWKMFVGFAVIRFGFEFKTSDFYGFGYLLSTLVAMKMHERGIVARMVRGMLQVSLQGAAFGSLIGFGLTLVSFTSTNLPDSGPLPVLPLLPVSSALVGGLATQSGYDALGQAQVFAPTMGELGDFRSGVSELFRRLGRDEESLEDLSSARFKIRSAGFSIGEMGDGMVLITQTQGSGQTFMINPQSGSDLVITVPDTLALSGIAAAAVSIFQRTDARALAINSGGPTNVPLSNFDGVLPKDTMYSMFQRAARGSVLQIIPAADGSQPTLVVTGSFPRGFNQAELEDTTGEIKTSWGRNPVENAAGLHAEFGLATLALNEQTARKLIQLTWPSELEAQSDGSGIGGYLRVLTEAAGARPAVAPPSTGVLRYFEREVLTPLLQDVIPQLSRSSLTADDQLAALASIDLAAQVHDYRLRRYRDASSASEYLVLQSNSNGWGTFAFRVGSRSTVFLHVPRPFQDERTLAFGLSLNQRLGAAALLVAGPAVRNGRPDSSLDMLNPDRPPSLYDMVSKALIRQAGGDSLSVVLRTFVASDSIFLPPEDIVLSFDRLSPSASLSRLGLQLIGSLEGLGLDTVVADGRKDLAGYETGALPQAGYLKLHEEAEFAVLWTSPRLRESYADRRNAAVETALFLDLGVQTRIASLSSEISGLPISAEVLGENLRVMFEIYQQTRNPVALQRGLSDAQGFRKERFVDTESGQAFILLIDEVGGIVALINLAPLSAQSAHLITKKTLEHDTLRTFVEARSGWLIGQGPE